jgi:hypothetical protein
MNCLGISGGLPNHTIALEAVPASRLNPDTQIIPNSNDALVDERKRVATALGRAGEPHLRSQPLAQSPPQISGLSPPTFSDDAE